MQKTADNPKFVEERGPQAAGLPVWDIGVRFFHWSLVALVSFALLGGFFAPAWWLPFHVWAGYGIAALVVFRVVWGFLGSTHARFADFAYGPRATLRHVRSLLRGEGSDHVGHNPLGALMVFGLLIVLAAILATGLVVLGGQEKQGALAAFTSFAVGLQAKEIHEALAILLALMIAAHIFGVLGESLLSRENLVRAMITGRKLRAQRTTHLRAARPLAALLLILLIALPAGVVAFRLSALPPLGVPRLAENTGYTADCGDCHTAYHPSLLPEASWRAVMSNLGDHFGEDASLADERRRAIEIWLSVNASERWDTEAANRLRHVSAEAPLRITATPFWQRTHKDIDDAVFKSKPVGSKAQCGACHKDATSGRFDDALIAIPRS